MTNTAMGSNSPSAHFVLFVEIKVSDRPMESKTFAKYLLSINWTSFYINEDDLLNIINPHNMTSFLFSVDLTHLETLWQERQHIRSFPMIFQALLGHQLSWIPFILLIPLCAVINSTLSPSSRYKISIAPNAKFRKTSL